MQDYFSLPVVLPLEWKQCANDFLRHTYEDHSQSLATLKTYNSSLKHFFLSLHKSPQDATQHDIRQFLRAPCHSHRNRGGPPSASQQHVRRSVLAAFYSFASTYIPPGRMHPLFQRPNPTLGIVLRPSPTEPRGMSEDEISRFFAVIPTETLIGVRDRAIFLLYLYTARRRAEIARLNYGDIEPAIFPDGKGRRKGWRYRYIGKGRGKQIRYAELPGPAKAAIDRYLEKSGRLASITGDDPLFVSMEGGTTPLHSNSIERRMKHYLKVAGLDSSHSLHSFRHTSAQQRHEAGESILSINKLLDHSSLDMTKRYLEGLVGVADPGAPLLEAKFGHL